MEPTTERRDDYAGLLPFEAVLDSVTIRCWLLDRDLTILAADGGLEPFCQPDSPVICGQEALIGRRLDECLPASSAAQWTSAARALLAGDRLEAVPQPADCSQICRMEARTLRNPAGEIDRVQFLLLEVRREAVQAAVSSRRQRARDQLDVVRQLAVSLNHEINNPLFVVSASLEDALAEPLPPDVEKRLQGALDAVWRVAEAVKLLQEIRQVVTKPYIPGFTMIDLEASAEPPAHPQQPG